MLKLNVDRFESLSPQHLYRILQLRSEVFVLEQTCAYQDLDGLDLHCFHVSLEDSNGEILAYARLVPPGVRYDEWSVGRVVSRRNLRRQGYGRRIVQAAIDEIQRMGGEVIRISAQSYLVKFYQDFGFRTVGDSYLEDGIPHHEMVRTGSELGKN